MVIFVDLVDILPSSSHSFRSWNGVALFQIVAAIEFLEVFCLHEFH